MPGDDNNDSDPSLLSMEEKERSYREGRRRRMGQDYSNAPTAPLDADDVPVPPLDDENYSDDQDSMGGDDPMGAGSKSMNRRRRGSDPAREAGRRKRREFWGKDVSYRRTLDSKTITSGSSGRSSNNSSNNSNKTTTTNKNNNKRTQQYRQQPGYDHQSTHPYLPPDTGLGTTPPPVNSLVVGSGSLAMYNMFAQQLDDRLPHPDVSRVVKFLFASLAVVFRETHVSNGMHANGIPTSIVLGGSSVGLDAEDLPQKQLQYTRLASIPAAAARMLWKELLGGIDYVSYSGHLEVTVPCLQRTRNRWSLTQKMAGNPAGSNNAPFSGGGAGPSGMSSHSMSQSHHYHHQSQHTQHQQQHQDEAAGHCIDVAISASVLRNFVAFLNGDEKIKNGGENRSHLLPVGGFLKKLNTSTKSLATDPKKRLWRPPFLRQRGDSQTEATMMETSMTGSDDPFLQFIRDTLVDAGFLEIATGSQQEHQSDKDDTNDTDVDSQHQQDQQQQQQAHDDEVDGGHQPHVRTDDTGPEEKEPEMEPQDRSMIDLPRWARKVTKSSVKEAQKGPTEFFQIYKDMQHQFGIYLSSLPIKEGGFSSLDIKSDDTMGAEHKQAAVAWRELDTLQRWGMAMTKACRQQLCDGDIIEEEYASRAGLGGDGNDQSDSPWMKWDGRGLSPFDDSTVYAIQQYPTHLMQCGKVVEAARILMNPRFFLARLLIEGAFEAANRQRTNIEDMMHRSKLAQAGQYEIGGDGDSINPNDIMYASVGVMMKIFRERYPLQNNVIVNKELEPGDVGRAIHLISAFLAEQGNSKLAIETYQESLEYKISALGPDHPSVGRTCRHLGHQHLHQYEYDDAIKCYSESVRIEQLQDDVDYKRVILSLNSMGMIYGMTGQPHKAVEAYGQSVAMQKSNYGDKNLQMAETLNSMGIVFGMVKNFQNVRMTQPLVPHARAHAHRDIVLMCLYFLSRMTNPECLPVISFLSHTHTHTHLLLLSRSLSSPQSLSFPRLWNVTPKRFTSR